MALAIVQHSNGIHTIQVPGVVTLAGAPTAGNLIIAFIGCNIASSSITVGASWTKFEQAFQTGNNSSTIMVGLYRYAQVGDTAALPALFSAGSTYWSHQIYEISGVNGSWDNDLLTSIQMGTSQPTNSIAQIPVFTSSLALTGFSRYNGNANPSITGTWTLDDSSNNNTNFGSAAGAHRAMVNGDALDGAWSGGGTSTPVGAIVLILAGSRPSTGKPVVRHVFGIGNLSGAPSSAVTPPWVPKQGCLQVCYLFWSNGTHGNPTLNTSDWTEYANAQLTGVKVPIALYRYCGASETTLKAITTAGGPVAYYMMIVELDSVRGTFGSDHPSNQVAVQASGATLTTTSDTTTANDQLALLAYGNYNGAANASTTGFTGYIQQFTDNGDYGSMILAFKYYASSGGTVQGTITPNSTTNPQSYNQDIFFGSSTNYSLTSAQGSYALTGQAALFPTARKVTAVNGLYTLAGKAVLFPTGRRVTAVSGLYVLTGEDVASRKTLIITAVRGLYTLTGKIAGLNASRFMSAHRGVYHLQGQDTNHGRSLTFKAKYGKYRVKRQKTILRLNTTISTIWPVDDGFYSLDGQDVTFGKGQYRLTFSGFVNIGYLDWQTVSGADFSSYLDTAYVIPGDAMTWMNVPYLYVFLEDGQSADDVSLILNVVKDWAETGNTPKEGQPIQVYRYRDGFALSVSKNRVRGKGRAMQLQFKSEAEKAFNLRGWAMWLQKNNGP